jgi:hypothetical protein
MADSKTRSSSARSKSRTRSSGSKSSGGSKKSRGRSRKATPAPRSGVQRVVHTVGTAAGKAKAPLVAGGAAAAGLLGVLGARLLKRRMS